MEERSAMFDEKVVRANRRLLAYAITGALVGIIAVGVIPLPYRLQGVPSAILHWPGFTVLCLLGGISFAFKHDLEEVLGMCPPNRRAGAFIAIFAAYSAVESVAVAMIAMLTVAILA